MSGLRSENKFLFRASSHFAVCGLSYIPRLFSYNIVSNSLPKKETNHQKTGNKFRIPNINLVGFLEITQVRFPLRGQFLQVRVPNRRPNKASEKEEPNRKPTISNIRRYPRILLLPDWQSSENHSKNVKPIEHCPIVAKVGE